MEDPKSPNDDADPFFDADDDFPFFDCPDSPPFPLLPDSPIAGNLRRRRSHRRVHLVDHSPEAESTSKNVVNGENSVITVEENVRGNGGEIRGGQVSWLVYVAELVVKAIGFQFNLLISFITFPFWGLYVTFMLIFNPFYVIMLGRSYFVGKVVSLWNYVVVDALSPYVCEWIEEHKHWLDIASRFGWGLLWAVYACVVLVSMLGSAFVISGLVMRFCVLEEPFQLTQGLNFDYTKSSPEAYVPVISCSGRVESGETYEGESIGSGVRVIRPKQRVQATITLVVPESLYNRNLGMFQVRVDFLSEKGKSLARLSHPCMLEFKSEPLRLLLTFFKIVPLVAGYVSESQTLNLKLRGYTESVIPTACLRVMIEQRAEFQQGAGIPEIYGASLHLEAELPFLKRILWYWRKTIYVWVSMMLFMVELMFALVCCRFVIFPRIRTTA